MTQTQQESLAKSLVTGANKFRNEIMGDMCKRTSALEKPLQKH
ncbi:hypothetical protein [Helicobacter didelphidarum]|nr:hypothetical protein [Helicobacter didelphidarum]